ncbi:hypothetical protein WR25_07578 isoform A [Diploscapter pachys]|uniref:SH2 domain-containing protein n=3 Tax=Diploscapter pachys TaxID=2018661 RepID=A0A2A2LQ22_9BILA|nr:hypothetical protein WR25_07578 isoform A [Diploscapter pachys]
MDEKPSTSECSINDAVYYHGNIMRIMAESLLEKDGDFLVRDSISSIGDFVLTAQHKGEAMHFQINRSTDKTGSTVYHFEEESFSAIEGLINFYLSHQRSITLKSGCIIRNPINRARKVDHSKLKRKELEASYMHILRPSSTAQRNASSNSLMQRACLNKANRVAAQRPLSQSDSSQRSAPIRVPPLPASLANRPLPLPVRISTDEEDQNDYDEMDYEAMLPVADTKSTVIDARRARSPFPSTVGSIGNFHRQFRSCTNLTTSSGRNSPLNQLIPTSNHDNSKPSVRRLKMTKEKPALPPRPNFIPPKPVFFKAKSQLNVKIDDVPAESEAEAEYDEPRPAAQSTNWDKHSKEKPSEKRLSGGSDSSCGQSSTSSSALTSEFSYDDFCKQSIGTSTDADSGFYSSPSPPSERNQKGVFDLGKVGSLRHELLAISPKEICLILTREDAELMLLHKSGMENGLRQVLLPVGMSLRKTMVNRSRLTTLSVLTSLVVGTPNINRLSINCHLLSVWVQVASHLQAIGNYFSFVNVIDALVWWMQSPISNETISASSSETRKELNRLMELRSQLADRTLQSDHSTVCLPFLQPILEILCSGQTQFLNRQSYSMELDSFFCFMDSARSWTKNADKISTRVQHLLEEEKTKCVGEKFLSTDKIKQIFDDPRRHEDTNYESVVESLHKIAQNSTL